MTRRRLAGWSSRLRLRVRAFLKRERVRREIDGELDYHIEMRTRDLVGEGMVAAEARAQAHRQLVISQRFAPQATRLLREHVASGGDDEEPARSWK